MGKREKQGDRVREIDRKQNLAWCALLTMATGQRDAESHVLEVAHNMENGDGESKRQKEIDREKERERRGKSDREEEG